MSNYVRRFKQKYDQVRKAVNCNEWLHIPCFYFCDESNLSKRLSRLFRICTLIVLSVVNRRMPNCITVVQIASDLFLTRNLTKFAQKMTLLGSLSD